MDEEQLQQLQLSQAASAGSTWQMGGGTAGLRAPAYTNNGTYLAPPEPQTTNARPPVTGAPSMYVRNTPSTTASNNAPFDSRRVTNAMYDSGPQTATSPATPSNRNNQNPVIDAGQAVINAGSDALSNPFVGEGINTLANINEVAPDIARRYTPNTLNRNLAELNRPGTTATSLVEAQAAREASNVNRVNNLVESPALTRASSAARNAARFMPVAGLYFDSTGLYDNVTGTGSAENASNEERAYNMVMNGTGLVSSGIGTGALVGQGLAASSTGLAGSVGTGMTALMGEGTLLAGAGTVAGTAGGLMAAGAGGYALGTYINEETGASEHIADAAYGLVDEHEYTNTRGFNGNNRRNVAAE